MKDFSDFGYLIEQLISGNNEAWTFFLKQYGRLIYYCIKKILKKGAHQEDLEECFQEIISVFLEDNCRRLKEVRTTDEKTFRSWLGMVSHRRAINFSNRKNRIHFVSEEVLKWIPDKSINPDKEAFLRQIKGFFDENLDDREKLVTSYILDGLSLKKIAANMDLSISTVHNIKKKAIKKIKKFIQESGTIKKK
ncbi:MAG: RNA polymerase sigma factor [bacterium]